MLALLELNAAVLAPIALSLLAGSSIDVPSATTLTVSTEFNNLPGSLITGGGTIDASTVLDGTAGGDVGPGGDGTVDILTVIGIERQPVGSTYRFDLSDVSTFDQLAYQTGAGWAEFRGTFAIAMGGGYEPKLGQDRFPIVVADSIAWPPDGPAPTLSISEAWAPVTRLEFVDDDPLWDGTRDVIYVVFATPQAASVMLSPASASLTGGGSTGLTATALDALGQPIGSPTVTWTSLNPAVAIGLRGEDRRSFF